MGVLVLHDLRNQLALFFLIFLLLFFWKKPNSFSFFKKFGDYFTMKFWYG